ncbi:P2Y purinoceptor 14-like [Danio rerio]|uniref:P2Y purinoceptor 14-like n=1 Tax=Danio rerio TaxID=7955 RepID=A0AC58HER7_DANRE
MESVATKSNTTKTTEALCEIPAEVFIFPYSLVFLVSLVLNCITMWVYFCTNQRVQSSITVYMKNLVAADFLLCLCLPFRIAFYANPTGIMSIIYRSIGLTAFFINMYASIFFMDLIAMNRYLKITRPLETHTLQTVRTARYISIAVWLFMLTMSSVYITTYFLASWGIVWGKFPFNYELLRVFYILINCVAFGFFIFILVSLIFFNWKTIQKLREVQLSTQTDFNRQKFRKSKQNMLVLVVIFCVCFVPYHLVILPSIFIKPLLNDSTSIQALCILEEVTFLLVALSVSLDPLIYFFFSKVFREQINLMSCQNCI